MLEVSGTALVVSGVITSLCFTNANIVASPITTGGQAGIFAIVGVEIS